MLEIQLLHKCFKWSTHVKNILKLTLIFDIEVIIDFKIKLFLQFIFVKVQKKIKLVSLTDLKSNGLHKKDDLTNLEI